ncbi:MAG: ankyrin repeat domain-containing protein [Rhodospirillaceae bacterium]|nr:ankyrin repeat domain-containing protein [Rhodospirillaceae bacterium]MBL6930841.1 ankyrin repeat domain-containing protein [Rhodospirillales bacterium]
MIISPVPESAAQEPSEATKQLFDAVYDGNLAKVQISIAGGGDINALNAWGITPVDLAVDKGYFDIVHYLLQVRDLQDQKKKPAPAAPVARVTALGATPNLPQSQPLAPVPAAAPVGEVYAPPPDAGPWSATVVTSEPPPPPPVAIAGPSPFDQEPENSAALPVIGTVRGPASTATDKGKIIDTRVQAAVEDTFQEVVKKRAEPTPRPKQAIPKVVTKPHPSKQTAELKPEPKQTAAIANDEPGIWGNIKSFLSFDDKPKTETPAPSKSAPKPVPVAKAAVEPQQTPVVEVVKSASLEQATAPVSPPNVTGPPPDIEGKVLPENVTPARLAKISDDDLEPPQVIPVQPKVPPLKVVEKVVPPDTTVAKVTRIDKSESLAPKKIVEGTSGKPPVQVGTTTLPGKPREQDGFFSKVMSIFSSDEEKAETSEKSSEDNNPATEEPGDWSVKNVEQAQVVPRKPTNKVVRELPENRLDGVILSLGKTTSLGKAPPPQAPAPWYYRSCINKKLGSTVFCIEPLDWPSDIQPYLLTDSILYEGTQSIVRYDEGAATYFHILFPSQSYSSIVQYFSNRYGAPTQKLKRSIAPLAEPRKINPTVIWQSIAPVTNLLTTLEIRMFDDNRGGFPDTKRGAIYLYHEWSQPVFPQLSSVELMLLRSEVKQR